MALHTHNADAATIGWYNTYFSQLVGATIIGFELTRDDSGFDEPGWLFGLPSIPPAGS